MLDEANDPFRPTRTKVFLWGTGIAIALCGLVFLCVPPAPKDALRPVKDPGASGGAFVPARTAGPQTTAEKYTRYCAQCHGDDGRSDTRMAGMMAVKPTNLVDGPFRYERSLDAVRSIIANGGGAMPGFGAELGEEGVNALADHVLAFPAKK